MNTKVLRCHICIADGRRQGHGWELVTIWRRKEEGGRACALREIFLGENPPEVDGPRSRACLSRMPPTNLAKLRIVSTPIGHRKAEAMPTCRGCVPIRNFASPTSSTSNLASLDKDAWFRIRPLPPAHTMIAQRAGTTALRRGTHFLSSICQFNGGSSELG